MFLHLINEVTFFHIHFITQLHKRRKTSYPSFSCPWYLNKYYFSNAFFFVQYYSIVCYVWRK